MPVQPPRVHIWAAGALAVAVPVAMDPGGYFTFLPIKSMLATALVGIGLSVLILGRRPLRFGPPAMAFGVLVIVFVFASLAGNGGPTSWIGYPGRSLGLLAWVNFGGALVFGSSLSRDHERSSVVRVASAGSIVISLYAILQAAGIDPIEWSENVDLSRTRSTLGNAAFLGAYLAMVVPLAGRLAASPSESTRARLLHATAAATAAIALLTTETRGAWIGALAGAAAMGGLEVGRIRSISRRTLGAVSGGAIVVVVVLATVAPVAGRVRSIADPTSGTGRGRIVQWDRTLEMVADRPVLGWGLETYANVFPRYIDAEFEQKVGRVVVPDRAHTVLLDIGSAAGGVGVAAYVAVLVLLSVAVLRGRREDPLVVALAGAVVAYLVQLQFSFPVADLDTVFWLLAGMMVAAAAPRARSIGPTWALIPLTFAVASVAWGVTDMVGDHLLRRALTAEANGELKAATRLVDRSASIAWGRAQYLQASARLYERVGEATGQEDNFRRGLRNLDDADGLVPGDLDLQTDRADLLLAWGEVRGDRKLIGRSATGYERILAVDRYSSAVHLKLGVAYVQLDRPNEAERQWRTAAFLAPRSPGPLIDLGLLYAQQGKRDAARAVLRQALRRDPANQRARDLLRKLDSPNP